jgi:hypothetical protein
MVWFLFACVLAVVLIGAYGFVRLRRHETDPVVEPPTD